jgi:hypothetical protein
MATLARRKTAGDGGIQALRIHVPALRVVTERYWPLQAPILPRVCRLGSVSGGRLSRFTGWRRRGRGRGCRGRVRVLPGRIRRRVGRSGFVRSGRVRRGYERYGIHTVARSGGHTGKPAPGPPEHTVDHHAVIGPTTTPLRFLAGQQRLQPSPLLVAQIVSIEHPLGLPHPLIKIRGTRSSEVHHTLVIGIERSASSRAGLCMAGQRARSS